MSNLALEASGAEVVTASSIDPRHPPSCVIDGNESTFWATTGLFPQEIIVKLGTAVSVTKIKTVTTNVKTVEVDKCEGMSPTSWERVFNIKVPDTEGRPQLETNQTPRLTATFLRFKITSGWDDFATVHRIVVEGAPVGK